MDERRKVGLVVLLVVIIGAILIGCGPQPTPVIVEKVIRETVVVTQVVERVVTATPMPIHTATPRPTVTPTPNPATGALQELVAAVFARMDSVKVENKAGAANFYVIYVDKGVREKLVAYRAAKEGLSNEQQAQMQQRLEGGLEQRNEIPFLLFVQPAEGTSVTLAGISCEPVKQYYYGWGNPVRFDSIFRKEITKDTIGFYYFPMVREDGIPWVDAERDGTLRFYLGGTLAGGEVNLLDKLALEFALEFPGSFSESCYIDLLPTEPSLALLPDVVAEYIAGPRPVGPPPSGLDINIQWDLSAGDVLTIIGYLLKFLEMMGVGAF